MSLTTNKKEENIIISKLKSLIHKDKESLPSFQEWLGIKEIIDGQIIMTNNNSRIILKISPINIKLKSNLEQRAILFQYKSFLKNINSKMQIIISSKKTDVSFHINKIQKIAKENPPLIEMSQDYIGLVNKIKLESGSTTKSFYIVIEGKEAPENDILKISEYLSGCGNEVEKCTKEEIKSLIRNFTNNRLENLIKE